MQLQSESKRIAEKFANKPTKIQSKLCGRHPVAGARNLFQPTEKITQFHFDNSKPAGDLFPQKKRTKARRQVT